MVVGVRPSGQLVPQIRVGQARVGQELIDALRGRSYYGTPRGTGPGHHQARMSFWDGQRREMPFSSPSRHRKW